MNYLQYQIESFCREHGIETPMFWNLRQDCNDLYAVSLHLHANDKWEVFDARAVFVLYNCSDRDSKEAEKTLLLQMFKELGEPLVLTIKVTPRMNISNTLILSLGATKETLTRVTRARVREKAGLSSPALRCFPAFPAACCLSMMTSGTRKCAKICKNGP